MYLYLNRDAQNRLHLMMHISHNLHVTCNNKYSLVLCCKYSSRKFSAIEQAL